MVRRRLPRGDARLRRRGDAGPVPAARVSARRRACGLPSAGAYAARDAASAAPSLSRPSGWKPRAYAASRDGATRDGAVAEAEKLGHDPVWTCAACLAQMSRTPETAEKAGLLFDSTEDEVAPLTEAPCRDSLPTAVPTDPLIHRFHESVQVYGTTWKEMIHEGFGDGIMSPNGFDTILERRPARKSDRVRINMSGKSLPYKRHRSPHAPGGTTRRVARLTCRPTGRAAGSRRSRARTARSETRVPGREPATSRGRDMSEDATPPARARTAPRSGPDGRGAERRARRGDPRPTPRRRRRPSSCPPLVPAA